MKIILISKVANHGNIGDIIEVKNGYAKNFLIPKNKAIFYSKENYKIFDEQKSDFEIKNNDLISKSIDIQKLIEGKDISIIENASDDGRLYGAVNTTLIAKKINEIDKTIKLSKSNILLEKPIKNTGIYTIKVILTGDVEVKLRAIVSRNESEIIALIKQFDKSNISKESEISKEEAS